MASIPMTGGGGADVLSKGEYIWLTYSTPLEKGSIQNNQFNRTNNYAAFLICVDDYNTVTGTAATYRVVGFNDVTDATELTVNANVPTDISSYKYLLFFNWNAGVLTFA